jgi:TRAP-type C4-dicarboxylate transport system substrate-binding protein
MVFYRWFERLKEEWRNVVRDAAIEVRQHVVKLTEMQPSVYSEQPVNHR